MPRPVFSRGEPVGRSVGWMKWETLWFRDGNNIIIIILFRGQEERFLLLVFVVEKLPQQPQPHTNRQSSASSSLSLLLYTPTTIPLKHTAPCAHEFRVLVCVCACLGRWFSIFIPRERTNFPKFSSSSSGRCRRPCTNSLIRAQLILLLLLCSYRGSSTKTIAQGTSKGCENEGYVTPYYYMLRCVASRISTRISLYPMGVTRSSTGIQYDPHCAFNVIN